MAGLYGWATLRHGWVPHDDGALAQSAARVLAGEIPHKHFDELYTGGLTYINAAAFKIFGARLISLRYPLFLGYLLWVPVVFWVAKQFVPYPAAGAVTLVSAAWSIPNYPAGVPSWYGLFLTTGLLAALLKHARAGGSRWLLAGGLCAGAALLIKSTGLYAVATGLFYIAFREQELARMRAAASGGRWYSIAMTALGVGFVGMVVNVVEPRLGAREVIHFVVPSATIVGMLLYREWAEAHGGLCGRAKALARLLAPFLLGCLLPVIPFSAWYCTQGAFDELLHGIGEGALRRLTYAGLRPLPLWTLVMPLVLGGYVVLLRRVTVHRHLIIAPIGAVAALLLLLWSDRQLPYLLLWFSLAGSIPVVTLLGFLTLVEGSAGPYAEPARRLGAETMLTAVAIGSLNQFPFSAPIYFVYVAPLVILAVLPILNGWPHQSRTYLYVGLVVAAGFAVLRATPGFIYDLGHRPAGDAYTTDIGLGQGGILVLPEQRETYKGITDFLQRHAFGEYIWAGPDAPEVYFLSGFRNPTRSLFEFLGGTGADQATLLGTLSQYRVRAIVVNRNPDFSPPLSGQVLAELAQRYPSDTSIGRFTVRWSP